MSDENETVFVPYVRSLAILNGVSVVDAGRHEVLRYQPETNTISSNFPSLACSHAPPTGGPLGERSTDLVFGNRAGAAIRQSAFARLVGEFDCGGLVTVAEAGASSKRDFVLLLVGAVFSLGAALVLEIGLDMQRRRFGRQSVVT